MAELPYSSWPTGPGRSTSALEAEAVAVIGSRIHVAYCIDLSGTELAVAVRPLLAAELRAAIARHERPRLTLEPWQILPGFPRRRPTKGGGSTTPPSPR